MTAYEMDEKTRNLKREIEEVFERYRWRDDIENELYNLGMEHTDVMDNPDEQLWFKKNEKIFVLVSWVDAEAYFFVEIDKRDFLR